jgi:hypothetical protein
MIGMWVVDRARDHQFLASRRDSTLKWILNTPRAWRNGTLLEKPIS